MKSWRVSNWQKLGLETQPVIYFSYTANRYWTEFSSPRAVVYYKKLAYAKRKVRAFADVADGRSMSWKRN